MYFRLLTFLTLAVLFHHSHAEDLTPQEILDAHNKARDEVSVGPMTWDDKLAAFAMNHTKSRLGDCKAIHSTKSPYGENISKCSISYSAICAVNLWLAEKKNYNYTTNKCALLRVCGHYTQMVWRNSVRVGCGRALCDNGKTFFTTCSYDPPGNYQGQKPY